MDIFDKTQELAASIKKSGEYTHFLRCKEMIAQNPKSVLILRELHQYQIALEFAKLSGEGIDEVNAALEKIFAELNDHSEISEYLTAEYKLSLLIHKIQTILTDGLELIIESDYGDSGYLN